VDTPFNPPSLALGAEATFVARALDSDRKGLTEVLRQAAAHRGTAFVEIYQDCPIFNDGSFDVLRKGDEAPHRLIPLTHGEPVVFGPQGEHCVVREGFGLRVIATADVAPEDVVVHDALSDNPEYAYALSRLSDQELNHTVIGVFRRVTKPTYDDQVRAQVAAAKEAKSGGHDTLQSLLTGKDTWAVSEL
jgi:2-oxoglutarate ferredoxin oxidoreductase subunit beta